MSTDKNMFSRSKNKMNKPLLALVSISACAVAALSLAPTVLSTRWGTNYLCKLINKTTQGTLQIQSLSLSWFGDQSIEGINFSDAKQTYYASCQSINSNSSLISILSSKDFGDMTLMSPHLKVKKDISKTNKIQGTPIKKGSLLFIPVANPDMKNLLFSMQGRILVKEGTIDVLTVAIDPITISDIQSTIFISKESSNLSVFLKAVTTQGMQKGTMSLSSVLKNVDTFDSEISINAALTNLPTRGLDQVAALINPSLKNSLEKTLGGNLNLDLSGQISRTKASLNFNISSDKVQGKLSTLSDGNVVTINEPGYLTFKTDADTLRSFWRNLPQSIQGPVTGKVTLSLFELPIKSTGININDLKMNTILNIDPVTIAGYDSAPIVAGPMMLNLDSRSIDNGSNIKISCPVLQGSQQGMIKAEGNSKIFFFPHRQLNLNMDMINIPSKLLSNLADRDIFSAVLGNSINAQLSFSLYKEIYNIQASIDSTYLKIKNAKLVYKDELILQEPLSASLQLTEELYQFLHPRQQVALSHPVDINMDVKELSIPSLADPQDTNLKITLKTPKLDLIRNKTFPLSFNNIEIDLDIATLSSLICNINSPHFSAHIDGSIDFKSKIFTPKNNTKLSILLDDNLLGMVMPDSNRVYLTQPAKLQIEFIGQKLPIDFEMISKTNLQTKVYANTINIQNKMGTRKAQLQSLKGNIDYYGVDSTIDSKISLLLQSNSSICSIDVNTKAESLFKGNSFSFERAMLSGNLNIQNMPVHLLQIGAIGPSLTKILGTTVDIKSQFTFAEAKKAAQLSVISSNLSLNGSLLAQNGTLQITSGPMQAMLTVTPESYLEIDKLLSSDTTPPPFSLTESTVFSANITDLKFPLSASSCPSTAGAGCLTLGSKDTKISAVIQNEALSFTDNKKKRSVSVKNSKISLEKQPGDSPLQMTISTETSGTRFKGTDQNGTINIQASLSGLYDSANKVDLSKMSTNITATINKAPSSVFDFFASTLGNHSESFTALFGQSITAVASANLQNATGPVKVNINTINTRASLSGMMNSGALTLKEPIYAQVTMTPELSKFLLGEVNPLSITEIRSTNPITIEIQPQGFVVPVIDFSFKKINIPYARLELGQISCKNEGNLNLALSLLKSVQLTQNQHLNLWFTPIDFSLRQGTIDVDRADILVAETFDIALWGQIYPLKDNVDMVLGLTADCLARAFNIKNLPDDYVLQIPMTGSLRDVKLNTGKATAKVAALLALQQADLAGGLAGGPTGALFGKFINKLGALPLNDRSTPPAKRPFPWEKNTPAKQEPPQNAPAKKTKPKKAHFKKGDKPLKQVFKLLK